MAPGLVSAWSMGGRGGEMIVRVSMVGDTPHQPFVRLYLADEEGDVADRAFDSAEARAIAAALVAAADLADAASLDRSIENMRRGALGGFGVCACGLGER